MELLKHYTLVAVIGLLSVAILFGLGLGMKHMGFWLGDALAGYTPFVIFLFFYFIKVFTYDI